uniref:MSP domain-containing protein n=1 Tax=Parascaris equorum TaxID=6256 RepID=A0A914RXH2_PAREQ
MNRDLSAKCAKLREILWKNDVNLEGNKSVYKRPNFKVDRPPQSQSFTLINHGEHAFAFKIHTSDNYAYFVSQVFGVVLGRRLFALPHVRTRNSVSVTVFRRPTKCFKVDDEYPNIQRTELLVISDLLKKVFHNFIISKRFDR